MARHRPDAAEEVTWNLRAMELEEADYISSEKSRNGAVSMTTVALTGRGREALGAYTKALRELLSGL